MDMFRSHDSIQEKEHVFHRPNRSGDLHQSEMNESHESNTPKETPSQKTGSPLSDIRKSINEMQQRLAFLDDFQVGGTSLMQRMGDGGRNFVQKTLDLAEDNEGILPRSFDLDAFRRDVVILKDLGSLADELRDLAEAVSKGEAAIGSQAFAKALIVQQAAKMGNVGGGLDEFLGEHSEAKS